MVYIDICHSPPVSFFHLRNIHISMSDQLLQVGTRFEVCLDFKKNPDVPPPRRLRPPSVPPSSDELLFPLSNRIFHFPVINLNGILLGRLSTCGQASPQSFPFHSPLSSISSLFGCESLFLVRLWKSGKEHHRLSPPPPCSPLFLVVYGVVPTVLFFFSEHCGIENCMLVV